MEGNRGGGGSKEGRERVGRERKKGSVPGSFLKTEPLKN